MGVQGYLFAVIAVVAAAPVAVLGVVQARRWAEVESANTDRVALAVGRSLAAQLAQQMLGHVKSVEVLAGEIQALGSLEPEGLARVMRAHAVSHPEDTGIMVLDSGGTAHLNITAAGQLARTGLDYSDREYFKRVRATRRTVLSHEVLIGRVSKMPNIHAAAPVLDPAGDLMAVAVASIDLQPIGTDARAVASGLEDGRVVVVDARGRLIADSDDPLPSLRDVSRWSIFGSAADAGGAADGDGPRSGTDERGREARARVVPIMFGDLGWRVIALRTVASIRRRYTMVEREAGVIFTLALLAAVAAAGAVASWLSRPVRALAESAEAVGGGDLRRLPALISGGPREVASLSNAVRSMVERLRSHADELELKVDERTEQLTHSNRELGEALGALRQKEKLIADDIEQARMFQEKMLPQLPSPPSGAAVAVAYLPLNQVSGDLYDIFELAPGRLRVFIADVTGHGVQAAMRTIFVKAEYDRIKAAHVEPTGVLEALNARLVALSPRDLFCTACCFDVQTTPGGAELRYADAAHVPLLAFGLEPGGGSGYTSIDAAGPFLGVREVRWKAPLVVPLPPGAMLLAATDGLFEQKNDAGEQLELTVLPTLGLAACTSARQLVATAVDGLHAFRGSTPLGDDVTIVGLRIERA
jgi:serine phosphatase RsbU (regulator of sigma subunit)